MFQPMRALILGLTCGLVLAAAPIWAQFKEAPEGGFPPATGRIAFVRDQDVWVMAADGSGARQLVPSGRVANRVAWSPDNTEIMYCQDGFQQYELPAGGGGKIKLYDIFVARADAPKDVKQISTDAMSASPSYFPDGLRMAFTRNLNTFDFTKEFPNFQVYVGGVHGNPKPALLNKGEVTPDLQLLTPAVSPDGKRIACVVTNEDVLTSPKQTLGIAIFPAEGFKVTVEEAYQEAAKIPTASGPAWSPNGKYLAYVDATVEPRSLALYDFERQTRRVIYKPLKGFDLTTSPPSWSKDGNWLVFANVKGTLLMVDRNGANLKALTKGGTDSCPAFSN